MSYPPPPESYRCYVKNCVLTPRIFVTSPYATSVGVPDQISIAICDTHRDAVCELVVAYSKAIFDLATETTKKIVNLP